MNTSCDHDKNRKNETEAQEGEKSYKEQRNTKLKEKGCQFFLKTANSVKTNFAILVLKIRL